MKLTVGEPLIVLEETLDFRQYAVIGELDEIRSVPAYGKGRVNLYFVKLIDGNVISSYYQEGSKFNPKVLLRKRRPTDRPVFTMMRQVYCGYYAGSPHWHGDYYEPSECGAEFETEEDDLELLLGYAITAKCPRCQATLDTTYDCPQIIVDGEPIDVEDYVKARR
jgi:hypothetical protein